MTTRTVVLGAAAIAITGAVGAALYLSRSEPTPSTASAPSSPASAPSTSLATSAPSTTASASVASAVAATASGASSVAAAAPSASAGAAFPIAGARATGATDAGIAAVTASASASASARASGTIGAPAASRLTGSNFAVDARTAGCAVDRECTLTLALTASGGYHINKEYPYKFTADASPSIDYLGKPSPLVFAKATGDFSEDGETVATMRVRFKPRGPGTATIAGMYKLSVCSAENCQIEQVKIAHDASVR